MATLDVAKWWGHRILVSTSIKTRDDTVRNKSPILVPALPILFCAYFVVVKVQRHEKHLVVKWIQQSEQRSCSPWQCKRTALKDFAKIIDVAADSPKS